jgi:hypothetical protein
MHRSVTDREKRWRALAIVLALGLVLVVALVVNVTEGRSAAAPPKPAAAEPVRSDPPPAWFGGVVNVEGGPGWRAQLQTLTLNDPNVDYPSLTPSAGNRIVSVRVHVLNTGSYSFNAAVELNAFLGYDGTWQRADEQMDRAVGAYPSGLEPGAAVDRTIVFQPPKDAPLNRLQVAVQLGSEMHMVEWMIA